MRVIGHGIDLIRLSRVKKHLENKYADWIDSIFTERERGIADNPPNDLHYYAGRYAAKEAIAKALGTGFSEEVTWQDIEILRSPNGAPSVELSDGARCVADSLGITAWFVSISHSGGIAVASAVAVSE